MTAFYNDFDRSSCAWLRELVKAGHIADGVVDGRSIAELGGSDLGGFTRAHFFAGIGGWDYALRLAGWPADRPVWTGSCPCQPFSSAGRGAAESDHRHLWPEFFRLIAEYRPPVVFGEQVASKAGRAWLAGVRADLESLGYAVGAADLCSAGVGAPHIRQRLYWVADAQSCGRQGNSRWWQMRNKQEWACREGERPGLLNGSMRCGPTGGVAESESLRHDGGTAAAEQTGRAGPQGCGDVGGMGDPAGIGPCRGPTHGRGQQSEVLGAGLEGTGGVGNADDERRMPIGKVHSQSIYAPKRVPFWSAYDLIPCRDGKARRVEPGTFPLAHGVSGRVGLLRGYGNAITPQVAAEFIAAYMEATA